MIFAALNYIAIFGSKTNDLAISSINKQFRLQLCLLTINAGTQPGHRLSSHYGHTDPLLQDCRGGGGAGHDVMSIARVADLTGPAYSAVHWGLWDRRTVT